MAEELVIKITLFWLFVLGKSIGELRNELTQSITRCEIIKDPLVLLSMFQYTKSLESIGIEANRYFDDLIKKYPSQENACIDSKDHESLKLAIVRWEDRFLEISKSWILSYPETHLDASKLLEGIKTFLSDEEFNTLEPVEKQGLDEATSSLLFGNFISTEFMALRTAESMLRRWYEKKTGKKLGRTTWGAVLEKLNVEFPKKEERPKELLLLDYLRERRNEIAHPEAVSDSVQASTTFLNVILLCKSIQLQKA